MLWCYLTTLSVVAAAGLAVIFALDAAARHQARAVEPVTAREVLVAVVTEGIASVREASAILALAPHQSVVFVGTQIGDDLRVACQATTNKAVREQRGRVLIAMPLSPEDCQQVASLSDATPIERRHLQMDWVDATSLGKLDDVTLDANGQLIVNKTVILAPRPTLNCV